MRTLDDLGKLVPKRIRTIITFSSTEVTEAQAKDIIKKKLGNLVPPFVLNKERFEPDSFEHLDEIGVSLMDLEERELSQLKKVVPDSTVIDAALSRGNAVANTVTTTRTATTDKASLANGKAISAATMQRRTAASPGGGEAEEEITIEEVAENSDTRIDGAIRGSSKDSVTIIPDTVKQPSQQFPDQHKSQTVGNNLASINAQSAWNKPSCDGSGITIAVLDTGIYPHSDFGTGSNSRIQPGGKRFTSDGGSSTDTTDGHGHGTQCAGIIAGASTGVARAAKILPVKILKDIGTGNMADLLRGLNWVAKVAKPGSSHIDVHIVSLSVAFRLASTAYSKAVKNAVKKLRDAPCNCIVVAGSGNASGSNPTNVFAPANTPGIVAVGAVDTASLSHIVLWNDSAYGGPSTNNQVTVVAPGVNVPTIDKGTPANLNPTATMTGTSAACACAAGALALVRQKMASSSVDTIELKLKSTARNSTSAIVSSRISTLVNTPLYTMCGSGLIDCDAATNP